jgi:CTP:phosphocholine cytidylyltransferase-like protein
VSGYTFTDVQGAHTIAATFSLDHHDVEASAGSGGSISPAGTTSVACGADQAYAIGADPCYSIADVVVDGGSVGAVSGYTFTNVQTTHTIAATFSLDHHAIDASAGTGGSISPSGPTSVGCGADQAYAITANSCYSVADVTVDGGSVGAVSGYTFTNVQTTHTIAATFSLDHHTIDAAAGAGGSISPSGPTSVGCGADQAYAISASSCYSIADVTVDGSSVGVVSGYTFTNVQSAHTIAASFSLNGPYTVSASAGTGGSISPSGAVSVACGATQAFAVTPTPATRSPTSPSTACRRARSPAIPSPTSRARTRSRPRSALNGPYTVTASAGSGGSISPSGAVSVACGATQAFSITANSCRSIANVTVDGVSQGAVAGYTFTNVQGTHTIAATFSVNGPYTVTASAGSGGSISPSGAVSVACGATQAFAVTANACNSIANVTGRRRVAGRRRRLHLHQRPGHAHDRGDVQRERSLHGDRVGRQRWLDLAEWRRVRRLRRDAGVRRDRQRLQLDRQRHRRRRVAGRDRRLYLHQCPGHAHDRGHVQR